MKNPMKNKKKLPRGKFQSPDRKISNHTNYRLRVDNEYDDFHPSETNMVEHIEKWEKKHRRLARLDEVVDLFKKLQVEESIEPHSGLDFDDLTAFKEVAEKFVRDVKLDSLNVLVDKRIVYVIENTLSAIWLLTGANGMLDVTAIVHLYISAITDGNHSYTTVLKNFFLELFSENPQQNMEGQSGFEFVSGLRNWRNAIQNPAFEKMSFILSFMVSIGLIKKGCFSVASFEIFKFEALDKQKSSRDILDGIFSTLIFFMEKGYECFATCSLSPLWRATSDLNEFDEDMAFLLANIKNVRDGNLQIQTGKTDNEYCIILDRALERIKLLVDQAPTNAMRAIMLQKRITLQKINSDFHNILASSGMREAPFCYCLFGKSSVGKTSLNTIMLNTFLKFNGYSCKPEDIVTIQDSDKYDSNYRTCLTGVIMDDMCNTNAERAVVNPTARIIQFMNNVRTYANMAEAERKGSTFIQPKVVAITTNSPNLDASFWSCEPVSVLRRLHVRIVVKVKEEYATYGKIDSDKIALNYPIEDSNNPIKDIWKLTPQYLMPIPGIPSETGCENYNWIVFRKEGKELVDINIHELMEFLLPLSQTHFKTQQMLVREYANFGEKIHICNICCKYGKRCTCAEVGETFDPVLDEVYNEQFSDISSREPDPVELLLADPHSASIIADIARPYVIKVIQYLCKILLYYVLGYFSVYLPGKFEQKAMSSYVEGYLYNRSLRVHSEPVLWFVRFIPEPYREATLWRRFYYWVNRRYLKNRFIWDYLKNSRYGFISILFLWNFGVISTAASCVSICIYGIVCSILTALIVKRNFDQEVRVASVKTTQWYNQYLSHISPKMVLQAAFSVPIALTTVVAVQALWRMYKLPPKREAQSELNPVDDNEVEKRNALPNIWMHKPTELPKSYDDNKTYTAAQMLQTVVRTNGVHIWYHTSLQGPNWVTGGLYIKSDLLLVPRHIWYPANNTLVEPYEQLYFDIARAKECDSGGWKTHNLLLYYSSGVRVANSDLMLFPVPAAGPRPDITKFFPNEIMDKNTQVVCSMRGPNGVPIYFNGYFQAGDASYTNSYNEVIHLYGGRVEYSIPTFKGMCMSILVADCKPPYICGLHLAGKTDSTYGAAASITRAHLSEAFNALRLTPGYCEVQSTGTLPTVILDTSIGYTEIIDPRSPINFLGYYNAVVYGSCSGGARYDSKVGNSMIHDVLVERHNMVQKWGKPRFYPQWKPWYSTLEHLVVPRSTIDPNLLAWAMNDYLSEIIPKMAIRGLRVYIRPLSMEENINGIAGVRFLDGLKMSTSIGFPLAGAKSKYLEELCDEPLLNGVPNRRFKTNYRISERLFDCEQVYLKGERCHHIFKACLKDEPTKLDKDKVRVFEAAPILLQLLIRKYYLPTIRFLSMIPLLSECAVGVNCYSNEWAELHEYITYFGNDRILAGDYSKWDLRLPAHLVLAGFEILIRIARMSGNYTEDQLKIMSGIATDVAFPVVAYNGTLLELHGSNPSGQNLTAHVNSICNSLLLRMAFRFLTQAKYSNFRTYVHAMTYGDDLTGSVSEHIPEFNHVTLRDYLKTLDIEFTMPDKTSVAVEYMHIDDVDFLKRRSIYNPELQRFVGALDLDSINKALLNQRTSKSESRSNVMRSIIQSQTHELVLHGRDIYNHYMAMLRDACEEIHMVVPELNITYDYRIAMWYYKYDPDPDEALIDDTILYILNQIKATNVVPVVGSMPDNVMGNFNI